MGKSLFSYDFKRDAVLQLTEWGYPVAEVADRSDINKHSLYEWKKHYSKPVSVPVDEQGAEIRRLKRELDRVTEGRDILKKTAAYFAKDAK